MQTRRRINLLYVNYSFDVGGIETLVLALCKHLDKDKFNIAVCSFSEHNSLSPAFEKEGIPLYVIRKREGLDFTLSFRLRSLCRQLDIDVMHTHNAAQWMYGVLAAVGIKKLRIIHTQHTVLSTNSADKLHYKKHKMLLRVMRFLAKRSAYVVAIAEYIKTYLVHEARIPAEKVTLVYNGIDPQVYRLVDKPCIDKSSLGIGDGQLVIGIVARLVQKKGHKILFDAFRMVVDKRPNVLLLVVGDGDLAVELKQYVEVIGIKDKTIFLGNRDDVKELLSVLDLFVLSSFRDAEGLSISMLEAAASGVPIVATDSGGNAEVIINGLSGFVVPAKSSSELSTAILTVLNNPGIAQEFSVNGLYRVKELFNINAMIRKYEDLCIASLSIQGH
ncbi:MAG: putative glycosyltransferase EpsF [Pelotomaculum sp. PtaU1.Bin065]|nr:MAG: putative glycosyltransferase EpsF [Pelotomaculum sp. PtaU1.Bin065]